jgi:Zn-dependent M32 family carboxypeptidase
MTAARLAADQHPFRGRRLETEALVRAVTGEGISPRHLLRYLRERYLPLCERA